MNVLKFILEQKESEDIMAKYFNTVFLRPDMLQNLTSLLTQATCGAIADEKTKEYF